MELSKGTVVVPNSHHNKFTHYCGILVRDLFTYRRTVILIVAPILFLPLLLNPKIGEERQYACGYVVLLMTAYWISECMPLAVTSFLPIFMFPFLKVLGVDETCRCYLKDVNFLFVGGLIMAVATEECHLHKRVALSVLSMVGSKPHWLILGFMLTTAFLSMWMSNVAATAMMVPIVLSMLDELIAHHRRTELSVVATNTDMVTIHATTRDAQVKNQISAVELIPAVEDSDSGNNHNFEPLIGHVNFEIDIEEIKQNLTNNDPTFMEMSVQTDDPIIISPDHIAQLHMRLKTVPHEISGLCKAILLSICYAANLGGTGTLTGTGPNIVLTNTLKDEYRDQNKITFASWMIFAVPPMLTCLLLAWIWLMIMFLGWKSIRDMFSFSAKRHESDGISQLFKQKYAELGKITFAEKSVLFWFSIVVLLWISRKPTFTPGWEDLLKLDRMTSDACPAMLIACVLFVWPSEKPDFMFWRENVNAKPKRRTSLMTWPAMQKKFSWSIIMLLGGGYAMARGIEASGLQQRIGCTMKSFLFGLDETLIVFVVVLIVATITVVASNTATASIFLPVLVSVAQVLQMNPLYFVLPATAAASYAFILPIATPPNAVIYETKMITLREMVIAGTIMTILCIAVAMLNVTTLSYYIFDLGNARDWIKENIHANETCN